MRSTRSGKLRGSKRTSLRLYVAQKQSMRYVTLGVSLLSVLLGTFIYFNFFNSSSTHAETVKPKYRPTYTTTEINVPVRLLIKAGINSVGNSKSDKNISSIPAAKKEGRGQLIPDEKFLSE